MSEPPSRPALGPTLSHPTTGLAPPQVVVLEDSDNQIDIKINKHKDKTWLQLTYCDTVSCGFKKTKANAKTQMNPWLDSKTGHVDCF